MAKTLTFSPVDGEYNNTILIDKIVKLTKSSDGMTFIHLTTGEVLVTDDSIRTLEARINSKD